MDAIKHTSVSCPSTSEKCNDCGLPKTAAWIDVQLPDKVSAQINPDGVPLCINCISRRCADAGLTDVPVKLEAGPLRAVSTQTSDWFLPQYAEYLRAQDKAKKTAYNYLIDIRLFAEWLAESGFSTSLLAVDSETVIAYRQYLQSIGRKPNTINRNLVALRLYFEWLVTTERILRNPARPVKRVAQVAPKPRQLTAGEVARILNAVKEGGSLRDAALFAVLVNAGLRASEVCALKWDALTLNKLPRMVEVRSGKGNKYRIVPLNDAACDALVRLRDSLEPRPAKGDYLFGDGKPMPTRSLHALIQRYAAQAGVDDVSAHDFRHFFAYQVIKSAPIHILKELMGHSSIVTTAVYTGPTLDDLVKATAQLSA